MAEVADVLDPIAITPDIVEALVEEARLREGDARRAAARDRGAFDAALAQNAARASALLDKLLDGVVSREAYAAKVAELDEERRTLENRISSLTEAPEGLSAQVEALARTGAGARIDFDAADETTKREVLAGVLCNLSVEDGRIGSYQWKGLFGFLEKNASGPSFMNGGRYWMRFEPHKAGQLRKLRSWRIPRASSHASVAVLAVIDSCDL